MNTSSSSDYDARARPKPFTFYPPKTSPLIVGLVKKGLRGAIRRKLRVTQIEISDDDLNKLKKLKGQRCMLTPSHSGGFEPHIVLYLSKLLNDIYHYVAAIELFEQSPINRWLMPRLGVYSIIRGAVDRPSFSMTRNLLANGNRWLVVFPEGQTIWQNSTLVPFQQGVIQLAFKAFEDAKKADEDVHLYCIPVAIKYLYLEDMHEEIDASLERLESALLISGGADRSSRYSRLRGISEAVLIANEKAHHVTPDPESAMNDRIQSLKEFVISKMERQLDVVPTDRQTLLDRLRVLFNAVDRIVYDEPVASEYEQQLTFEQQQVARTLYEDLWRLLQFVAIYDGYVGESITVERFMDVLCLLEMEVFKKRRIWGPRRAHVRVGEPIDLKNHCSSYAANKRDAVQEVTLTLESSVRGMLDEMGARCTLVRESN
ncbi:MAG: lysophospholipid acyltransferase family protein [Aeoliella sp.]